MQGIFLKSSQRRATHIIGVETKTHWGCKMENKCEKQMGGVLPWHTGTIHVLTRAGLPSMYRQLRQCRLRWLGHVHCMEDGSHSQRPP